MGTQYGENIDRKQAQAISALLAQPTIEKAAQSIGVSEKTLWRWMQDKDFAQAYDLARAQILEQTFGLLHKATGGAVATLMRNMKCGNPSVEVRAAIGILDQTMKAREMLETEYRLREIEEFIQSSKLVPSKT